MLSLDGAQDAQDPFYAPVAAAAVAAAMETQTIDDDARGDELLVEECPYKASELEKR